MLTPVPLSATVAQEVLDEVATSGDADFWVHFDARPDLSQASQIADWDARGQAVYDALTETAAHSQTDAVASLRASGAQFETFHISNAIKVEGGTSTTVRTLSLLPGVDAIYPNFEVVPPDVVKEQVAGMVPHAVAWGVADIGAPAVWDLGITGEHIVVATIDTGAQWDHPALVGSYRGNFGNGTFDHNYNWFDAAGTSAGVPADGNGHGTHVTGTMVGDDGGAHQIGVAPGATWIAANGCCPTDAALLRSGEWMLAPTDLLGANPEPGLRPHVINNSWGSTLPSNDPFLEDISAAWAAAGQFGVFANGNSGPACNTSTSPGSRAINYSVGNYTSAHTVGALSSRGAGQGGAIKPDISAPGTAIYSALPGGGYGTMSGTSMASPHVAGAVALLWSASPTLRGDVAATRALLDSTAIDTEDLQCGGTAAHNNVHGEGRLDVAQLIAQALAQDQVDAEAADADMIDASRGSSSVRRQPDRAPGQSWPSCSASSHLREASSPSGKPSSAASVATASCIARSCFLSRSSPRANGASASSASGVVNARNSGSHRLRGDFGVASSRLRKAVASPGFWRAMVTASSLSRTQLRGRSLRRAWTSRHRSRRSTRSCAWRSRDCALRNGRCGQRSPSSSATPASRRVQSWASQLPRSRLASASSSWRCSRCR